MENLITKFLNYLKFEQNYAICTIISYEQDLKKFKQFILNKKMENVIYQDIRNYLEFLFKQKYSKKTIARYISTLRSFYKYLYAEKIIVSNPMELIVSPKADRFLPKVLNYNEIEAVLTVNNTNTYIGKRNALVLEMLYSTGVRVSELVNIKLTDINKDDCKIKITGKGNKQRYVLFGSICLVKLNDYLKNGRIFLNIANSDYLFLNQHGKQLSDRLVREIVLTSGNLAGLKFAISPHVIRHTFATTLLNEGADLKCVQELLGHTNLSTTAIYMHLSNDHMRHVYLKCHPRSKK
ncbi:MAG: tyrosine recombinase [Bacilli bacterium]